MALNINNIDIDLKKGLTVSNQVADEAGELRAIYSDGLSIVESLRGSWTGDNAARYIALLEERLDLVNKRSKLLSDLSSAIYDTVMAYDQQQRAEYNRQQRAAEEAAEQARQAKSKKSKKK